MRMVYSSPSWWKSETISRQPVDSRAPLYRKNFRIARSRSIGQDRHDFLVVITLDDLGRAYLVTRSGATGGLPTSAQGAAGSQHHTLTVGRVGAFAVASSYACQLDRFHFPVSSTNPRRTGFR